MAWGSRYRRYRRYRRFYKKYGRGSRRAYGNMKAAKQQADNATFTINVPSKFTTFMKSRTNLSGLLNDNVYTTGVYPISIYDLLRQNEFFNNYASMYDEFKIDKIKVKLLPTSFTISTNGSYRNLTVYTAWDRTGLNTTQLYGKWDKAHPDNNKIYCVVGEDITTYSSSESRTVNPNTNTSITRWLNPKTIAEKSQWLSTGLLKKWYEGYNKDEGCFEGIPFDDEENLYPANINTQNGDINSLIKFSNAVKENPCFLLEDPSIKFKPTLLVGVFPAISAEEFDAATNKISFNVETEIVCTFRGLRKAKIVNGSTSNGQEAKIAAKVATIEADGTYYARNDGLDGWSSVKVKVPSGGNNLNNNKLTVSLTDDNVRAAQIRTDALNGEPLEGTIQYPSTIATDTNCYSKTVNDQTWINLESIDVGNLHLAKYHSQTDNLEPVNLLCSRKENVNINDAKYPTDYDFKTKIDIKYNDDQSLTTNLVEIQNSEVNIIDEEVNVGDISPIQGTVQEQLAVNGFLEPATSQAV